MTETNYIVLRPAPDLPVGVLPAASDGLWLDKAKLPVVLDAVERTAAADGVVAVPTGRFETRSDGAVAEVYEVRL